MSNNGRSISSAIERRLWQVHKEYKKLQKLGWNSQKYWVPLFPGAKGHHPSSALNAPEAQAWNKVCHERVALRYKTFVLNLYVAHTRGKIHCRKLTKTDLWVPAVYRDHYDNQRYLGEGPRTPAFPGKEILTLEDQKELLTLMVARAKAYPRMYGSAFEPGELDALEILVESASRINER